MSRFWIATIAFGTIFILSISPAIAQGQVTTTRTITYPTITALATGLLTILQIPASQLGLLGESNGHRG